MVSFGNESSRNPNYDAKLLERAKIIEEAYRIFPQRYNLLSLKEGGIALAKTDQPIVFIFYKLPTRDDPQALWLRYFSPNQKPSLPQQIVHTSMTELYLSRGDIFNPSNRGVPQLIIKEIVIGPNTTLSSIPRSIEYIPTAFINFHTEIIVTDSSGKKYIISKKVDTKPNSNGRPSLHATPLQSGENFEGFEIPNQSVISKKRKLILTPRNNHVKEKKLELGISDIILQFKSN